jgi:hypothetical protein
MDPQITASPVGNTKQTFPDKIVVASSLIYACPKCPTKAVYTENKDYVMAPVVEEPQPCTNNGDEICNAGYACDACPRNGEGINQEREEETKE